MPFAEINGRSFSIHKNHKKESQKEISSSTRESRVVIFVSISTAYPHLQTNIQVHDDPASETINMVGPTFTGIDAVGATH